MHGAGVARAFRTGEPANLAYVRHSRPDFGPVFQVEGLGIFQMVPSSLGIGRRSCPEAGSDFMHRAGIALQLPHKIVISFFTITN